MVCDLFYLMSKDFGRGMCTAPLGVQGLWPWYVNCFTWCPKTLAVVCELFHLVSKDFGRGM